MTDSDPREKHSGAAPDLIPDPITGARELIEQAKADAGDNRGLWSLLDAADTILDCASRQKEYGL